MPIGKKTPLKFLAILLIPSLIHLLLQPCFSLSDEEIWNSQSILADQSMGKRIAFWAEKFVGTPYDPDPLGEYVSKATIVADERVDCMYLTFRAVELASSNTPEEAVQIALEKRFHSKGIQKDGRVINYDDRFEYGEDMIESGKWGREVTQKIGKTIKIKGSRGKDWVEVLQANDMLKGAERLKSGDIVFFVKKPEKRKVGEVIGHLGIIKVEENQKDRRNGEVYLIHAGGAKEKGGTVKKILLKDYISHMPFIGAKITRFD